MSDLADELSRRAGYWYLATPYSKYEGGIEAAFQEACKITASLMRQGVCVFCPIAHTHPVAKHGGIDPLNHDIWIPLDRPMMTHAIGLIVAKMDGWEDSYGVGVEIEEFKAVGKQIYYLDV